jgi:hypothetical protein
MSAKLTSKKHEKAARLVADDRHSDTRIAELCGITERTLERWKKEPKFSERVQSIVLTYSERALRGGLARREKRVAVLNDMHDRMLTVIDERSEDLGMQAVPGGKSGLITKQLKGIGKGEDFQVVEVYEVDTALVRELRATQEQIAKELGQWVEKRDVKVNSILFERMSQEELERYARDGTLPDWFAVATGSASRKEESSNA